MSEKNLDIANARADIILALDNTATYESWLCIDTYIEQLQQENEHNKNILTEFEKWLEEYKHEVGIDEYVTIQIILNKLQELKKEGKK